MTLKKKIGVRGDSYIQPIILTKGIEHVLLRRMAREAL